MPASLSRRCEHVRSLITSPTYGRLNDRAHTHTRANASDFSLSLTLLISLFLPPARALELAASHLFSLSSGRGSGTRRAGRDGRESKGDGKSPLREDRRCQRPREGMLTRRTPPPCLTRASPRRPPPREEHTWPRARRATPAAPSVPRTKKAGPIMIIDN